MTIPRKFLAAVGENAGDSVRRLIGSTEDAVQAKLDKHLQSQIKNLAKNRQLANRGVGVIADLGSNQAVTNMGVGAGVGGLGGFLTAPGSESENMMGKTTYKSPTISDRLSGGLTGAVLGAGAGGAYSLGRLNSLAKQVAKSTDDMAPGVLSEFLGNISSGEQKALLRNAALKADPNFARRLALGKKGKGLGTVAGDWLHQDAVAGRAARLEANINALQARRNASNRWFQTAEDAHTDELLKQLLGSNTDLRKINPAQIQARARQLAELSPSKYKAFVALSDVNNVDAMMANINKAVQEQQGEYANALMAGGAGLGGTIGSIAGLVTGNPALAPAGVGLGSALGRLTAGDKFTRFAGRYLPTQKAREAVFKALEDTRLGKKLTYDQARRAAGLVTEKGLAPIPQSMSELGRMRLSPMEALQTPVGTVAGTGAGLAGLGGLGLGGYSLYNYLQSQQGGQ